MGSPKRLPPSSVDPAVTNVPGGTITVADNGKALSVTATPDSTLFTLTGVATIALPVAGTNTILVNYSGDANFDANSQTTSFLVQPDVTTTTMQTTVNPPSVYGQAVTVSATVANTSSTAAVTGWVDFYDNATATSSGVYLGSVRVSSTGTAQLTTSRLPVGSDSITADFRGNADFASTPAAWRPRCSRPSLRRAPQRPSRRGRTPRPSARRSPW